jgi:hypothetical protein
MRKSERDALDNALARKMLRQGKTPASGGLATPTTGTGSGNDASEQSVMTAKGDLITGGEDGAPVRLPVGTDGQVLTAQADGTSAWEDAPAGGGGGGGYYRQYVLVSDGSGGFALIDDGAGNPVSSLEATE